MTMHNPPHPGEILRVWLTEVTIIEAAQSLGITRAMLSRILNGAAAISADMDVRLSRALGTSSGHWLGLQSDYDLWRAQKRFKAKVKRIAVPRLLNETQG
jgi:addiction module HigA family antidote